MSSTSFSRNRELFARWLVLTCPSILSLLKPLFPFGDSQTGFSAWHTFSITVKWNPNRVKLISYSIHNTLTLTLLKPKVFLFFLSRLLQSLAGSKLMYDTFTCSLPVSVSLLHTCTHAHRQLRDWTHYALIVPAGPVVCLHTNQVDLSALTGKADTCCIID